MAISGSAQKKAKYNKTKKNLSSRNKCLSAVGGAGSSGWWA